METLSYPAGPVHTPNLSMTATVMGLMDDSSEACTEPQDYGIQETSMGIMGLAGSGGKSRRKQSKPIRVYMDSDATETEGAQAPQGAAPSSMPEGSGTSQMPREVPMDVDSSDMVECDLCRLSFLSQSQLNEHMQSVHGIENGDSGDAFPTKYHQLGSEFQEAAMSGLPSDESNEIEPTVIAPISYSPNSEMPMNPTPEQLAGTPVDRSKPNGGRIFHPDAYCELCDREFCNKYFLKTHKANKHGIYENGSSSSPIPGTNGLPTMVPYSQDRPMLSAPLKERPPSGPPQQSSPPASSQSSHPPNNPPTTSMPSLVPPMPATPTKPSGVNSSKPEAKGKDMEDYCEICQKHFCNKYYLKKHKQDVHGIIPDTPTQKRSRTSHSSTSTPTSSSGSPNSMHLGMPPAHMAMNGMPGMNAAMANVMFLNPFAPPMMLPGQPMLQALPPGFLPQGLGPMPPMPPAGAPEAGQRTPPSSSSSPGSKPPSDGQSGMGVNADAYCEICRKEFCNRYFLRIHKANKHGIYMPEDPPGTPGGPPPFMLPMGPDGGPMPLLPPETPSERKEKFEEESKPEVRPEEPEQHMCKLCNKSYPNQYALRVHQINAHDMAGGDPSRPSGEAHMGAGLKSHPMDLQKSPLDLASTLPTSEHANISGTMFGNMIAAKLADRVICDICNKEVCNKYFLKTHKMKVHGIDPNQLDREQRDRDIREARDILKLPQQDGPTDLSKKPPPPAPPTGDEKRPPDQELLKMGIDPEAYCEICKKEFCSKYFLRTHKQNIHGIKTQTDSPQKPRDSSQPKSSSMSSMPSLLSSMVSLPSQMPCLPSSLPMSLAHMASPLPASSMPLPLPPTHAQLPFFPPSLLPPPPDSSPLSERSSWKWREPVNATRVMCEFCNKELCNKYFLKTHMLNKHGMFYDHLTGQTSPMPGKTPRDLGPGHENIKSECTSPKNNQQNNSNSNSSSSFAEAMYRDSASFAEAMYKDSVIKSTYGSPEKGGYIPLQLFPPSGKENRPKESDDKSPYVSARTWQVPDSIKQEPAMAKAAGDSPGSQRLTNGLLEHAPTEGDTYLHKCDVCGGMFEEQMALHLHKLRDHGQIPQPPGTEASMNEARTSLSTNIGLNLRKKYQKHKLRTNRRWRRLGACGASIGEKVKSAIVNHIQNHQRRKKYRCAHCQERFFSRSQCHAHIRADHPNMRLPESSQESEDSRSGRTSSKAGSEERSKSPRRKIAKLSPPVQCKLPSQQESNVNDAYVMQSFTLEAKPAQDTPNFARSVVYLPVLQKVAQPVTVTFTLSPMEQ